MGASWRGSKWGKMGTYVIVSKVKIKEKNVAYVKPK